MSDTYYACYEAEKGNYWTCQGPYNTSVLADAFIKNKLCPRRTFIVSAPSYTPETIRQQIVSNNLLKTIQPSIVFKGPDGSIDSGVFNVWEWNSH